MFSKEGEQNEAGRIMRTASGLAYLRKISPWEVGVEELMKEMGMEGENRYGIGSYVYEMRGKMSEGERLYCLDSFGEYMVGAVMEDGVEFIPAGRALEVEERANGLSDELVREWKRCKEVRVEGNSLRSWLTPTEMVVLDSLMSRYGEVVVHSDLYQVIYESVGPEVWERDSFQAYTSKIARIMRSKIREQEWGFRVETRRGYGLELITK